MKKSILFVILTVFLFSCQKESDLCNSGKILNKGLSVMKYKDGFNLPKEIGSIDTNIHFNTIRLSCQIQTFNPSLPFKNIKYYYINSTLEFDTTFIQKCYWFEIENLCSNNKKVFCFNENEWNKYNIDDNITLTTDYCDIRFGKPLLYGSW